MSSTRAWRPGVATTPASRMGQELASPTPPPARRLTGELLELADRQSLEVLELAGGCAVTRPAWDDRGRRLPPGSGEVVSFMGKTMIGISVQELEWFLKADPEHLHGPRRRLSELSPLELAGQAGPGARLERLERVRERDRVAGAGLDPATWRPCDPDCELSSRTKFVGGPLAGKRHAIPVHGPALIRYREAGVVHWYAWKKPSLRTYTYVGSAP